jgi:hypothetical protein
LRTCRSAGSISIHSGKRFCRCNPGERVLERGGNESEQLEREVGEIVPVQRAPQEELPAADEPRKRGAVQARACSELGREQQQGIHKAHFRTDEPGHGAGVFLYFAQYEADAAGQVVADDVASAAGAEIGADLSETCREMLARRAIEGAHERGIEHVVSELGDGGGARRFGADPGENAEVDHRLGGVDEGIPAGADAGAQCRLQGSRDANEDLVVVRIAFGRRAAPDAFELPG